MFFLKALPTLQMVSAYTGSEEDAEIISSALVMMRKASLLIRDVEKYFAEHGLSQLKFLILIVIDREPGRDSLRHSEIAERLDVSKPVLHRTVKTLVEMGFLQQTADETDRRAEHLSVTDAGAARLSAVLPGYFDLIRTYMAKTSV